MAGLLSILSMPGCFLFMVRCMSLVRAHALLPSTGAALGTATGGWCAGSPQGLGLKQVRLQLQRQWPQR